MLVKPSLLLQMMIHYQKFLDTLWPTVDVNPNHDKALHLIGIIYELNLGNRNMAAKYFKAAIDVYPDSEQYHIDYAQIARSQYGIIFFFVYFFACSYRKFLGKFVAEDINKNCIIALLWNISVYILTKNLLFILIIYSLVANFT